MSYKPKFNSGENENMCVVCFKNTNIYSVGVCDHPVCYECSTRMRVLCRQNECPICRQDMPKVIFCNLVELFRILKSYLLNSQLVDRKYGIWFASPNIQRAYYQLLEHNCRKCPKLGPFRNFNQLKEHMRREHELHYCDLCVSNLRIFTWERKCYTRSELAQHRRKGDIDDTSHRGHPLCEFCDTRYMDSDDLFRHLRRDHLFCHFCDADGLHHYYSSYESLRQHFHTEHYLCEEGECLHEKFTSVFRTKIDFKAHKASVHGKHLSKAATKQARTLELEFTLAPRSRPDIAQPRSKKSQSTTSSYQNERLQEGAVGFEPCYPEPIQLTAQDFPSLSGASPALPLRPQSGLTIRHITRNQKGLARNDENFPALVSDTSTVRFSVNNIIGNQDGHQGTSNHPNVSIHVNHRANGAITTHISQNSNSLKIRPHLTKDFPALGSVSVPEVQWVKPSLPKEPKNSVSKVTPALVLPPRDSSVDFPSLSKIESKSKKSSVTVPVSGAWANEPLQNKDTKLKNKKKKSKNSNNNNNSSENESSGVNKTFTSASTSKISVSKRDLINKDLEGKTVKENDIVKKRAELKIDSLQISEAYNSNNHDDFPALRTNKLPPGISTQPPPGFAANITFTNSSGQSYSIVPVHQFILPPNFLQRNRTLVEKTVAALQSNDAFTEFKKLSEMFRNGTIPSDKYYDHCKHVMGNDFPQIFHELLVLLPDIEKQQELLIHHLKQCSNKQNLEVCETCKQVVTANDLAKHLASHNLENHFPALGAQDTTSVWRKQ